ncbi:MAG: MFS transporter [Oscillochloris sp.]|nr:MFS transporter [Oscillochloris sp.]
MIGFGLVWLGQVISLIGSAMTQFALGLWAWEQTGSATALALVNVFATAPLLILSPLAGVLVDRWDRRLVMIGTDLTAGMATIAIFLLNSSGILQIWHLYAAAVVVGAGQAFQWPAYSAAISVMVPKKQYGRANGMMSLAESGSTIIAPIMAGGLIGVIGLNGILSIDIITFLFAVGALLMVSVPTPQRSAAGEAARGALMSEMVYGFRYILARPGLLGLLLTFLVQNLVGAASFGLLGPYILARSNSDPIALGVVMSAIGAGGVVGGLLMSTWGGPKRRIHGVLLGMIAAGVFGSALMAVGRSTEIWIIAGFCAMAVMPLLNGSSQAIWQAKVDPDLQGRVFATRRLIAQISFPLGLLGAAPLVDRVLEPAMAVGGALTPIFGSIVGVGPGAGMAVLMFCGAVTGVLAALGAYLIPAIRNVERDLPDHDG